MILKNIYFKLMNNAVFGKKHGKCEKTNRDIDIVTTGKRRNYLVQASQG